MPRLDVGNRWAALTVTDVFVEREEKRVGGVTESYPVEMVSLECDCGKTFTIRQSEFKGRRHTRDCGCGRGVMRKHISVILTVYLEHDLLMEVEEFATKHFTSKSRAVRKLLRDGLAAQS